MSRNIYVVQRTESYTVKADDPAEAVELSEIYAADTVDVVVELAAEFEPDPDLTLNT